MIDNINDFKEYLEKTNFSDDRKNLIMHLLNNENHIIENDIKRAFQVTSNFKDDDYIKLKESLDYEARHELMIKLEENYLKRDFITLYTSLENKATLSDMLKSNNVFDLIKCKSLNKDSINDIIKCIINIATRDSGLKGIGKGEIFFSLFIDGNQIHEKKHGDVVIDDKAIEIKAYSTNILKSGIVKNINGGRLIANDNKVKDPKEVVKKMKLLFKRFFVSGDANFLDNVKSKNNKDGYCISNANNMQKVFTYIKENTNLNIYEIFEKISEALYWQFFDDYNSNYKTFIDKITKNITEESVGQTLINIHAMLAIMSYQINEKWDYLLVLNTKNGKYDYINANDIEKNSMFDLYIKLTNKFYFDDGPSNTPGANKQNYVATIYLKDNK